MAHSRTPPGAVPSAPPAFRPGRPEPR